MKVEINLPDPPEGYEYTGEFRCVEPGDMYLTCWDEYVKWDLEYTSAVKFITLKPVTPPWQPPTGILRPGWVARDTSGEVWWSRSKPEWDDERLEWFANDVMEEITKSVNIEWPDIFGEKAIWKV